MADAWHTDGRTFPPSDMPVPPWENQISPLFFLSLPPSLLQSITRLLAIHAEGEISDSPLLMRSFGRPPALHTTPNIASNVPLSQKMPPAIAGAYVQFAVGFPKKSETWLLDFKTGVVGRQRSNMLIL